MIKIIPDKKYKMNLLCKTFIYVQFYIYNISSFEWQTKKI